MKIEFAKDLDKTLFLISASECEDNSIRFVVALGTHGEAQNGATLVFPDMSELYEISFDDYILHQTRSEFYASYEAGEIKKGNALVIFEKSRLLDVLPALTDCRKRADGSFYPEKWTHYGLFCVNHVIDVISCIEPEIRKIEAEE